MQQQNNNLYFHSFSAFKRPTQSQNYLTQHWSQLQVYIQQSINIKNKIQLKKCQNYLNINHPLTQMLYDMFYSIQYEYNLQTKQANKIQDNSIYFNFMTSLNNGNVNQIPINIFKNICLFIQQQLFIVDCKYSNQLILSMLFEKGLIEIFKLCLINTNLQNNNNNKKDFKINFQTLDEIFNNLLNNNYRKIFIQNIYKLHQGNLMGIQKINVQQNLKCIINNIGKIFTEKTNLITRNLKNVKKSKYISQIVSHSVKILCNYKNQQFINEEISKIISNIFGQNKSQLNKEQFMEKMTGILDSFANNPNSSNVIHTLWLYIDLLRVQALMVNDYQLKTNILKQNQVTSSNFYTQQMQKLLKKCPYNGDQCCDCKKCQCVRRNRQSAKLSQQKKRNAVEQLDPLKKRIQDLQKRNKQLQEENKILRGIVSQWKNQQKHNKGGFQSTLESVSKVLNN